MATHAKPMQAAHFQELVEGLREALVACDTDGHIRYANHAARELLGRELAELEGRALGELVPGQLQRMGGSPFFQHLLERSAASRPPGGGLVCAAVVRPDGQEVRVGMSVGPATGSGGLRVVTLRPQPRPTDTPGVPPAQGSYYQRVFEHAPLGLLHFDRERRVTACNPRLADMARMPRERMVGVDLRTLRDERVRRCVERALAGEASRFEGDFRWPGEHRVTSLRALFAPVNDGAGQVAGGVILVEDATEQKRAEGERRRLLREAQEAVQVRDDFLSIASHELKTPLTPLSLRLAALQRRLERGQAIEPAALHQARQGLRGLTSLINDLLDSSRIADGRLALHPQDVGLDGLVERVARASVPAGDPRHPISVCVPGTPVRVRADPDRLAQVVQNLVDNAVKYSPGGGAVEVVLSEHGDVALLEVRDRGIGIPEDQQEHLFDRFFRARNVSAHKYGGLGLGLYICRDIVERHGGRIWVKSRPGEGSTFTVALPLLGAADVRDLSCVSGQQGTAALH